MKLSAEQFAQLLNGREYREEMTDQEEHFAKENNLIVIFGASDDLVEIRGSDYDELDAPTELYFNKKGLFKNECENDECPHEAKKKDQCKLVEALWCQESDISWTYKTDIPHHTFEIKEDGDVYCRGIVFSLDDVDTPTEV